MPCDGGKGEGGLGNLGGERERNVFRQRERRRSVCRGCGPSICADRAITMKKKGLEEEGGRGRAGQADTGARNEERRRFIKQNRRTSGKFDSSRTSTQFLPAAKHTDQ